MKNMDLEDNASDILNSINLTIFGNSTTALVLSKNCDLLCYMVILAIAISLLGVLGNVLCMILFAHVNICSSTFFILRILASSDAVFLVCAIVIESELLLRTHNHLYHYQGYVVCVSWIVAMTCQMITVWLTVLVSFERFLAVCYPFKLKTYLNWKNTRKVVALVCLCCVIFNIPRCFEVTVTADTLYPNNSDLYFNNTFRIIYRSIMYTTFLFAIPIVLLAYFNIGIIYVLKDKSYKTGTYAERERRITIIVLTVILVFLICGIPHTVLNILRAAGNHEMDRSYGVQIFGLVSDILVCVNSSSNFIIYCFLGKNVRAAFIDWCCKKGKQFNDVINL